MVTRIGRVKSKSVSFSVGKVKKLYPGIIFSDQWGSAQTVTPGTPGHPLRFSGKKAKPKKNPVTVQIVPKTEYPIDITIDVNDDGDFGNVSENDYSLTE